MRKWRVGTLSMGILLIALGIGLFLGQFNGQAALNMVMKWWSLILFLLGGEILWYIYRAKEEEPKVKYDVFSVFMILTIIFFSMGIYALMEVGVIPQLSKMVSAQNYILSLPYEQFELEKSIKKIIIEVPQSEFTVRSTQGKEIAISGKARVTADSKETAGKLLAAQETVKRQAGDTLYLSFNYSFSGNDLSYHTQIMNYTVTIPGDREVEIRNGYNVKLLADAVSNNWLIDGTENVNIRLAADVDVKIRTNISEKHNLRGNVNWEMQEIKKENEAEPSQVRGELTYGNGIHRLDILNGHEVTVNQVG